MLSKNQILTIKVNLENTVIDINPRHHCFLMNTNKSEHEKVSLEQVISPPLNEYYTKHINKIHNNNSQLQSFPAEILLVEDTKYLVQMHSESKMANLNEIESTLYFNFINIENHSEGRSFIGNYAEDKTTEKQLTSAFEKISLLTKENDPWQTEDKNFYNKL
jgi:hypothetical protein